MFIINNGLRLILIAIICINLWGCSKKNSRTTMIDSELEELHDISDSNKKNSEKKISFYEKKPEIHKSSIQKKRKKPKKNNIEDRFSEYAGYRSISLLSGRQWEKNQLGKAEEMLKMGNYEQAESFAHSFLYSLNSDDYPKMGQGYMMLADIYEKTGNKEKEEEAWSNFQEIMQNLIKNEKITKYKDIHKSRDEFLQTIFPDAKGEQPNKEE